MNKHLYRLVFSRRLGLRVVAPETARAAGKAAGGERRAGTAALLGAAATLLLTPTLQSAAIAQTRPAVTFAGQLPAPAQSLPQPFTSLMRDPAGRSFATPIKGSGDMGWQVSGKTATFNQGSVERVLLNWQSFDIAEGYTVRFIQDKDPGKYVTALNRVWSQQPSVIQGSLLADREVILQNSEGVYFGRTARVSAGKFVASTLAVSDATFSKGIRNVTDASAVFTSAGTDHKPTSLNSAISLEAGAEITTAAGGDVLLVAPRIVNQGRIDTPAGQAVLAAGDKVYLMSSSDPAQRGLIVAVDPIKLASSTTNDPTLGVVENSANGSFKTVGGATVADSTPDNTAGLVKKLNEIRADSGSVNLVGLSVRQNGVINATTAVKGANGAIFLQAMASTTALAAEGSDGAAKRGLVIEANTNVRVAAALGAVQLGAGSVTAVLPSIGSASQLDAEVFNPSLIRVEGQAISVASGASVLAPAGRIDMRAATNASSDPIFEPVGGTGQADNSRIVIAPGATLSAAGLRDVAVDGARNQGALRLFRIELADAPVQRNGPLYRSEVFFDLRDAGKVTLADVSGTAAALTRTASERSTAGGRVNLLTNGALVLGEGATLDVSGGSVAVSATTLKNSLLAQDGRLVSFRSAVAGNAVDGLSNQAQQTAAPAYTEGASGGALLVSGRQVALAGVLTGQVVQGQRQLDGNSPAAAPATLTVGQRDLTSYYLQALALRPDAPAALDAAIFREPLQTTLPGLSNTLDLSLAKISAGGFGGLSLRAAWVNQPAYGRLDLGSGGSFDIEATRVVLNGDFRAAGGRLSVVTPFATGDADQTGDGDIRLLGRTRLDAAGRWTNRSAAGLPSATERAVLDGGTVVVRSAHSLWVDAGAELDVSAGAQLSASGGLARGKAGVMTLATGTDPQLNPRLALAGVTLRAFDFDKGGMLQLGVPALTVGATSSPGFGLSSDFFSNAGFGNIGINAMGNIVLTSGTRLAPTLLNWQLDDGFRTAPSGTMSTTVATAQRLDPALAERKPVNLSMAATRSLQFGGAGVTVERGAAIELEPGGSLRLAASRGVDVGASGGIAGQTSTLAAPGGSVALAITGTRGSPSGEDADGFIGSQAIWLGAGARLTVDGVAQLRREASAATVAQFNDGSTPTPTDQRLTGSVLGGGSISLNAARGYVVAEAGSNLSLNGAAAALNFPGLPSAVMVAKPAGTLTVSTSEGFALDGQVQARAPFDAAGRALADGGRLSLGMGTGGVFTTTENRARPYSTAPRTLAVGNYDGQLAASGALLGGDLSLSLGNGDGYVRRSMLLGAGWSGLQLGAGDRIRFDTGLDLNVPLGVQLNAPAIVGTPGVQVVLRSALAELGDAAVLRRGAAPDVSAATETPTETRPAATRLTVQAPTIEVYGNTGLRGFGQVTLDANVASGGEIRFSAASPNFGRIESLRRGLNFAGTLNLNASQVFATTASQYSLSGVDGSRLVLRGSASGAPMLPPLSAFGSLRISATDIDQGGVLRQPFGQIALNASHTLNLGAGSVTSVSGDGANVLYGQTVNLTTWALPGGDTFFGLAREKAVTLSASSIVTAPTALVSARGGGAVYAWEFFPGVGGSRDVFEGADLYAVLPDYAQAGPAAVNGGIFSSSPSAARQFTLTMPGSGLTPGRYTLLPARDALLAGTLPQGAFLVSRASDQGRTVLRAPIVQDDGSVVVTGFVTRPGSVSTGNPGERFVVQGASTFGARSDIRLSDVSNLLASRAAALGDSRPPLPADAGQVQVVVSGNERAVWQARLDLAAGGVGLAGQLDVSAAALALVDTLAKTPAGTLGIQAAVLAASGAGSVLLGGKRSEVTRTNNRTNTPATPTTTGPSPSSADSSLPSWRIDASATQSLSVDLGTSALRVEELLLAASDSLTLAPGTQLAANNTPTQGPRSLVINGDGAFAAISTNALQVQRKPAGGGLGVLSVGPGSVFNAAQVSLDATLALRIDPTLRLSTQALDLGAARIQLGAAPFAANAFTTALSGDLLNTVRSVPALTLRGYSQIGFAGEQNWAQRPAASATAPDPAATQVLQRVVLDTPLLFGMAGADGQAARTDIAARDLLLQNTLGPAAVNTFGTGSLVLQALPPLQFGRTGGMTLGEGHQTLGFASSVLRSSGDLVLQGGSGSRTQANNTLVLSAARVTASTGAEHSLFAATSLRIATEAGGRTLGERVGQGADIRMAAPALQQDGLIDLPGSRLSLQTLGVGSGSLRFGDASVTSVAGFTLGSGSAAAYGTAGSLQASSELGNVEVAGTLDVSAARRSDGSAGEGNAGSLGLSAVAGTVLFAQSARLLGQAGAAAVDLGGRLAVDVGSLPTADNLARLSGEGGFRREFGLRVRTQDVALNTSLSARRISIGVDGGTLSIGMLSSAAVTLDASAPSGGLVQLAAGGDIRLGAAARIDARALQTGSPGGDVLLASSEGRVRLDPATRVDASGEEAGTGRIVLRAQRGSDNRSVKVDRLDTQNLRAGDVSIEAVKVYDEVFALSNDGNDGSDGTLSPSAMRTDNNAFMAARPTVLTTLGVSPAESSGGRVTLRAGVELRSSGDMVLLDDWSLAGTSANPNLDRPGGDAGYLTLRAAGNLQFLGSLSDGFANAGVNAGLSNQPRSWSYRLVAGADLLAAQPLATQGTTGTSPDSGSLTVAAGQRVRTGAGSIELAAARDLVFADDGAGGPAGTAYVAGRLLPVAQSPLLTLFAAQPAKPIFTQGGGRLDLAAGQDIVAPEATQLINNWFWRSGALSNRTGEAGLYSPDGQLAWWSEPTRFEQTVGSFGGGSLTVNAGRDIVNLQAMAPSAGWADSRVVANASLKVTNRADLTVSAGRDLQGGQFFVGHGSGLIEAGGSIGLATANQWAQAPQLALMDGTWRLSARQDLVTGGVFNPSAVPAWTEQNRPGRSGYFYTWGDRAGLNLSANAGSVRLSAGISEGQGTFYGLDIDRGQLSAFQVMPASLSVTAAGGNIELLVGDSLPSAVLFPSARGQLQLWSGKDVLLGVQGNGPLAMADNNPADWPQFGSPVRRDNNPVTDSINGLIPAVLGDRLALTGLHAGAIEPVRIQAQGSLRIEGASGASATLLLPKAGEFSAGQDVTALSLRGQNLSASDVTRINAGRNFLAKDFGNIELAGPGALDVRAGRNVDLGASAGISTSGNLRNASLPAQGAAIAITAASAGTPNLPALARSYLAPPQQGGSTRWQVYRELLTTQVRGTLKAPTLSYDQAWAAFQTFPPSAQAEFTRHVLGAEFAAVYLLAASPTAAQMTATLQAAFEQRKADVVKAGEAALAAGGALTLPGRDTLRGDALSVYLEQTRALAFTSLDLDSTVAARVASLAQVRRGWRERVAAALGGSAADLDALLARNPQDPRAQRYGSALADTRGAAFLAYRNDAFALEVASAAGAASNFGVKTLPMRLALFDQGFAAAELAGYGNFTPSALWPGTAPVLAYSGALDMTQSSVVTQRGGDISLLNPGGAITVGLKDTGTAGSNAPKGVIALGGGNIFGFARDDFQVNTQRVFIVGAGDMNIWSSAGDIDSGRGANTAVAAPPLAPRRSVDSVVFEVPATTTGSGLGILADAQGRRSGTIGLYPALGEILALDAFIRAPAVVLGSTIKGADNLQAAAVGGAAAPVAPPALNVAAPPASGDNRAAAGAAAAAGQNAESRPRNAFLTVELLGLGRANADTETDEPCSDQERRENKCKPAPAKP